MKSKYDTVGLLIFIAFSLVLAAFFSIWRIGNRTPAYEKTISQYFKLPRYFGAASSENRSGSDSKSDLKQTVRELFTGQIRDDYIATIDNASLAKQPLEAIFPGLAGFAVQERQTQRQGARISYTVTGKTSYHYDRDVFVPLSDLVAAYRVTNYNQNQVDAFFEPDQIQLHTREKRIFDLVSVEEKWYIAKIRVIPMETTLQPSPSDIFTVKTFFYLQDSEWCRINNELTELCRQKQYTEALTAAQNAAAIAVKLGDENHLGTGVAANNLAVLYLIRNQLAEAAPLFQKSLSSLLNFTNSSPDQDLIARNIALALPFMLNQANDLQEGLWSPADFDLAEIGLGLDENRIRELLGDSEKSGPEKNGSTKKSKPFRYKEYVFPKVLLRLKEEDSVFKVWQVHSASTEVSTFRGINQGDSKTKVLWVYGRPEIEEPEKLEYRITQENKIVKYLRFELDSNEKVTEIEVGFLE